MEDLVRRIAWHAPAQRVVGFFLLEGRSEKKSIRRWGEGWVPALEVEGSTGGSSP